MFCMFSCNGLPEESGSNSFSDCVSEAESSDQGENDRAGGSSGDRVARRLRGSSSSLNSEKRLVVSESAARSQTSISSCLDGDGLGLT